MPPHSHPSNYIRNSHRWCVVIEKPGSALRKGTPAMDLELKGIPTHMLTQKRGVEQNTNP